MTVKTKKAVPTANRPLRQLPYLVRALMANRTAGKSPARDHNWTIKEAPDRPACVADDSNVPVLITEGGIRFVRTPEECFQNLPGFPFEPHYTTVEGLRMHYVDEGPRQGPVVLMLHGQPSWSYLYRKMIPVLANAGYRAIAVDHIGMGRSDKPVELSFHTFEKHVQRLKTFITTTGLKDITLFCQDWGGLMGLRVVGDRPEWFARVVAANTTLPIIPPYLNPFRVPNPVQIDCALGDFNIPFNYSPATWAINFQKWILYSLTAPNFTPSQVVSKLTVSNPSPEELAAYDAPYPSLIYKAAPRTFPSMIAAIERQNVPAWKALGHFEKSFLFFGGEHDLNMGSRANQQRLTGHIPGAAGQPHERFEAGHFIQEDIGETLAERMVNWMEAAI
ncbi:MAG TPA: haloalkane dehalogenase [Chloroflexia bacterium]|nr:haloalkane dehalogenase [Chloroflexia bacterium]